jgi:hypothetical protein
VARSDVSASQHRNVGDIERRQTWPASQSARSTRGVWPNGMNGRTAGVQGPPRKCSASPKASLQTDSISVPRPLRRSSRRRCSSRKQPAGGFAACQGRRSRELLGQPRLASTLNAKDYRPMPQPARRRLTLPMDLELLATRTSRCRSPASKARPKRSSDSGTNRSTAVTGTAWRN